MENLAQLKTIWLAEMQAGFNWEEILKIFVWDVLMHGTWTWTNVRSLHLHDDPKFIWNDCATHQYLYCIRNGQKLSDCVAYNRWSVVLLSFVSNGKSQISRTIISHQNLIFENISRPSVTGLTFYVYLPNKMWLTSTIAKLHNFSMTY